jgi:hypothetical protein
MSTQDRVKLPPPPTPARRTSATVRVLLLTLLPVALYVPLGYIAGLFRHVVPFEESGILTALLFGSVALVVGFVTWRDGTAADWARIISVLVCGYIAVMGLVWIVMMGSH